MNQKSDNSGKLTTDVLEELDIGGIRKLLKTIRDLVRRPGAVLDSLPGGDVYTKPLRFALSIVAPILLLNAVLDIHVETAYIDATLKGVTLDPLLNAYISPQARQFLTKIVSWAVSEVGIIAEIILTVPVFAFLLSKVYRRSSIQGYYSFIGIALYLAGLSSLIGFVLIEFTYFVDVSQFPNVNTIIRFIYFPLVFTIFYRGIAVKRRAFRALLALGFNYLSTFLLALVLTVVLIFNFKPVSWHPRVTMGFIADTGHKDVRVFYVQSSSPADSAGLQAGDKVNSINGTALKSQAELRIFMDTTRAKLLHVNIQRGQTQTIVVTTFQPFERVFKVPAARLGWEEKEIDANSRVIIANVSEDGPGFKGGIRNGDELVTFNGQDINSNQNYLRYTVELYPSLKPGDTADVIIRRASKLVEVRFAVGTSRATRVMGEYY